MSTKKLLKRIVSPELSSKDLKELKKRPDNLASRLHNCTHGITSDPLAALAIVSSHSSVKVPYSSVPVATVLC
jgi:nucleotidyltransferase/DNA polymerase involved in DNA repair